MRERRWLVVGWGIILCSMLCGCLAFMETREPSATWMPLPTRSPTDMHPPSSTPAPTSAPTYTATPRPSTATVHVTETARIEDALARAEEIRDQAWAHAMEAYPDVPFPQTPTWRRTVDDTAQGFDVRYTSTEWRVVISVPAPSPQDVYAVRIVGPDGFSWQAEVDETGAIPSETPQVTATPTPTSGRVAAWRGRLRSLPTESAFDDYFRRLGGQGGQYGIEAADAALAKDLAKWRDSERIVKVWGVLQRDVEDYGDLRIRVERLEVEPPPPVSDSELVKGWIGTVHTLPSQSPYDDYFRAQSPSGQYGIASHMDHLTQKLEEYRDTGTVIRIWGVLDHGVSDYGEKRITVTRIQVIER